MHDPQLTMIAMGDGRRPRGQRNGRHAHEGAFAEVGRRSTPAGVNRRRLWTFYPEGVRVLVQYGDEERELNGPCRVPFWRKSRCYQSVKVHSGRCVFVHEDSVQEIGEDDASILVHPDATEHPFQQYWVDDGMAMVVVKGETGEPEIVKGPVYHRHPDDRVVRFSFTGEGDDEGFGMKHGGHRPHMINLQPQTIVRGEQLRFKDSWEVRVSLTIDWQVTDVDSFAIERRDTVGMMFRRIGGLLGDRFREMTVEEFIENDHATIAKISDAAKKCCEDLGITISDVTLRRWSGVSSRLQKLLEQRSAAAMQKVIGAAEHEARMEAIQLEGQALEADKANEEARRAQSRSAATREATSWLGAYRVLTTGGESGKEQGGEDAGSVLKPEDALKLMLPYFTRPSGRSARPATAQSSSQ